MRHSFLFHLKQSFQVGRCRIHITTTNSVVFSSKSTSRNIKSSEFQLTIDKEQKTIEPVRFAIDEDRQCCCVLDELNRNGSNERKRDEKEHKVTGGDASRGRCMRTRETVLA
jgi:hypothetical protein